MADSQEYLIADILPAGEVHLLGGSSGSGKTTFTFQTIAEWQKGNPILGHESFPVPYSYISIDRSHSSVQRTLRRLKLEHEITRILCAEDIPRPRTFRNVFETARKIHPDSEFFIIEGFQTLVGDKGNSYQPVADMLSDVTAICALERVTVIGVCHAPKLKIEEGFQHPRELLLGSVAWSGFSDTVITMDMNEKTGIITLSVMPRNAGREEHQFVFGPNGVLAPVTGKTKEMLTKLVMAQAVGTEITRKDVLEWAATFSLSERTADKVIKELLESGDLTASNAPGNYLRTDPPTH